MAKKVGICDNCDRNMYTNNFNLCKRCHQDVGYSYFQNQEVEEVETGPSLSDLGLDDTISPEAPSAEEVPEPEVKEESLEIKKAK